MASPDPHPLAPVPERPTLRGLRAAVQDCRACELWDGPTQAVLGEGLKRSRLMLVGEQPGDQEDRQGRPFVGPAGRLLDRALVDAGIDRAEVFVTNAVKHFRFEERGKRRIHQRPERRHVHACRPWLDGELAVVAPEVVVCLGATAAQGLLGATVRVTHDRGTWIASDLAPRVTVTVHPSSILRAPDDDARHAAYVAFVDDLDVVAQALGADGPAAR